MTTVSLLVVNYFSAALAARAIETARLASSSRLQVVVIDNSCDPAERAALESLQSCDVLIAAESNLGYARAINRAVDRCTGDVVVVTNPDIEFHPGSIDRLAGALEGTVGLAGPKFVWDSKGEWLLPPADVPSIREKSSEMLAERFDILRHRRSRMLVRRRVDFWSMSRAKNLASLSGAVMAMRTDVLRRFRFDERFQLYFEEADLMRRLRRSGLSIVYSPEAVCRHLFGQSSAGQETSDSLYAASEALFFEKWGGAKLIHALSRIARRPARDEEPFEVLARPLVPLSGDAANTLLEASPLADFRSAAGHFPRTRKVVIPDEILSSYRYRQLFLREIELDTGRTGRRWLFAKCV